MPPLTSVDWTNIGHIAEFAGFIAASFGAAFVQARRGHKDRSKTDRDEDDAVQKETLGSFSLLVENYKERIAELKDELSAAEISHKKERDILVQAVLNSAEQQGNLSANDLYQLRQIGIEIKHSHEQTQQHIERAKDIADETAQALDAESESDPDDDILV